MSPCPTTAPVTSTDVTIEVTASLEPALPESRSGVQQKLRRKRAG